MQKLKNYLIINSVFSDFSGFCMLLFSSKLNIIFNIENPYIFPVIGVNLLVFAVFVLYVAIKKSEQRSFVGVITLLDALWVLGSVVLLLFSNQTGISSSGNLLIGLVAVFIGFLALMQYQNLPKA
jgi:hypothetical protein